MPIQAYFNDWMIAITHLVQPFCSKEKAISIARTSICRLQGAMVMARITGDITYMAMMQDELIDLWREQIDRI